MARLSRHHSALFLVIYACVLVLVSGLVEWDEEELRKCVHGVAFEAEKILKSSKIVPAHVALPKAVSDSIKFVKGKQMTFKVAFEKLFVTLYFLGNQNGRKKELLRKLQDTYFSDKSLEEKYSLFLFYYFEELSTKNHHPSTVAPIQLSISVLKEIFFVNSCIENRANYLFTRSRYQEDVGLSAYVDSHLSEGVSPTEDSSQRAFDAFKRAFSLDTIVSLLFNWIISDNFRLVAFLELLGKGMLSDFSEGDVLTQLRDFKLVTAAPDDDLDVYYDL